MTKYTSARAPTAAPRLSARMVSVVIYYYYSMHVFYKCQFDSIFHITFVMFLMIIWQNFTSKSLSLKGHHLNLFTKSVLACVYSVYIYGTGKTRNSVNSFMQIHMRDFYRNICVWKQIIFIHQYVQSENP